MGELVACSLAADIIVFGVDIEPTSIEACRVNAAANGFEERCHFFLLPAFALSEDEEFNERFGGVENQKVVPLPGNVCPFDIVIANLWPSVQCRLAAIVASLLKPGGILAIGGLHLNAADDVIQAYLAAGI